MYVEADDRAIYVLDHGSMQLQLFDWSGEFVRLIGEGRGQGPGEFQRSVDVFVEGDRIWMVDGEAYHVSVFDRDGAFIERYAIEEGPMSVAATDAPFVVSVITGGEIGTLEHPLLMIDEDGERQREFSKIMEDFDTDNPTPFSSELLLAGEEIVRMSTFASYLFWYDMDGKHLRTTRMIDEMEFSTPEPEPLTEDAYRLPRPEVPIEYRNASTFGDTLAVHALKLEEQVSVIDYYATSDGAYLHSVRLPEPVEWAGAHRDRIVTLRDTTLTKYRVVDATE